MSNGKAWLAVGLGIVTGGLAFLAVGAIGLAALAPLAAGLAFSATTSLIMGRSAMGGIPGLGTVQGQRSKGSGGGVGSGSIPDAEELSMNTATEARPIPVVFGTARVGGNYVRYDRITFKTTPIYSETIIPGTPAQKAQTIRGTSTSSGGGKGGGGGSSTSNTTQTIPAIAGTASQTIKTLVGYNYRLGYDLAICCGPIDRVMAIHTNPGERNMMAGNPNKLGAKTVTPMDFSAVDRVARTIGDGQGFGGSVRVYAGSGTQERFTSDQYNAETENHRHVCFAHFYNFRLGTQPAPTTTIFEIERFPRALDADGNPIADFPVRGSADSGHPSYTDANPAAAMWELLTNRYWGAAIPQSYLNEASFKQAATFFEENDIGLSFVLTSQDIMSEAINFMREHVQTLLTWDGGQLKLVCLMDRTNAYSPRIRINRDQVEDPQFTRPTWPSTVNELRVNFINRENNHKRETVHLQDLGSIQAVGRIQSRDIDLIGFSSRAVAEQQAKRLLFEAAYPQASLSFRVNRIHSGIEAGSFVEFVWEDWHDGAATTYWRVIEIGDDQTDSGGLEIKLVEDPYAVPFEGTSDIFGTPPAAYLLGAVRTDAQVSDADDATLEVTGDFGPGYTFEPPGTMTTGTRTAIVAIQRESGLAAFANWAWEIEGSGSATALTPTSPWAITGTIGADIDVTRATARGLEIDLTMAVAADLVDVLDAANYLETTSDGFEEMTQGPYALLLIDDEIMRVGYATDQTGGVVRLTGILRGDMGTTIAAHSSGATAIFIPELTNAYLFGWDNIPEGEDIEFTADQITTRGSVVDDTQITFYGPNTKQFDGRSARPPAPGLKTAVLDGSEWQMKIRPRFIGRGSGTQSSLIDELEDRVTAIPSGYALRLVGYTAAEAAVADADVTIETEFSTTPASMPANIGLSRYEFIPDTGDADTCQLEIDATPGGTVATIRIWTILNGVQSADYTTVDL